MVVDKAVTSQSNGFIDLWLPRDKTYKVKITHEGKKAESQITTFENDATCITSMQAVIKNYRDGLRGQSNQQNHPYNLLFFFIKSLSGIRVKING